jgi:hypothetical protein
MFFLYHRNLKSWLKAPKLITEILTLIGMHQQTNLLERHVFNDPLKEVLRNQTYTKISDTIEPTTLQTIT